MNAVCAEKPHDLSREIRTMNPLTFTAFLFLGITGLFISVPRVSIAASYTVNVSVSSSAVNPAALQQDVLSALTTGPFLGAATKSIFANTYDVKLFGKNPSYQGPSVSTTLITLDTIASKLVAISMATNEFLYAQGMVYERNNDAALLGDFMTQCSTANAHDFALCNAILGYADDYIMHQTSGVAVVPYPLVGF